MLAIQNLDLVKRAYYSSSDLIRTIADLGTDITKVLATQHARTGHTETVSLGTSACAPVCLFLTSWNRPRILHSRSFGHRSYRLDDSKNDAKEKSKVGSCQGQRRRLNTLGFSFS